VFDVCVRRNETAYILPAQYAGQPLFALGPYQIFVLQAGKTAHVEEQFYRADELGLIGAGETTLQDILLVKLKYVIAGECFKQLVAQPPGQHTEAIHVKIDGAATVTAALHPLL
jgi:hypothetical protein